MWLAPDRGERAWERAGPLGALAHSYGLLALGNGLLLAAAGFWPFSGGSIGDRFPGFAFVVMFGLVCHMLAWIHMHAATRPPATRAGHLVRLRAMRRALRWGTLLFWVGVITFPIQLTRGGDAWPAAAFLWLVPFAWFVLPFVPFVWGPIVLAHAAIVRSHAFAVPGPSSPRRMRIAADALAAVAGIGIGIEIAYLAGLLPLLAVANVLVVLPGLTSIPYAIGFSTASKTLGSDRSEPSPAS